MQCIGTSWHNKQIRGGYFLGKGRVPICGLRWLYISHQLAKYWKNTEFSISQKHPFWQEYTTSRDPLTIRSENRLGASPQIFKIDVIRVRSENFNFIMILVRSSLKVQKLSWFWFGPVRRNKFFVGPDTGGPIKGFNFSAGLGTNFDRSVLVRRSLTADRPAIYRPFSWPYPIRDSISPRPVLKWTDSGPFSLAMDWDTSGDLGYRLVQHSWSQLQTQMIWDNSGARPVNGPHQTSPLAPIPLKDQNPPKNTLTSFDKAN